MKKVLIACLVVVAAGCSGGSNQDMELINVSNSLPPGATDIQYLGNHWVSFTFNGECFLNRSYSHRQATMKVKCNTQ